MTRFLALYTSGTDVGGPKLIAVAAQPWIVLRLAADLMLADDQREEPPPARFVALYDGPGADQRLIARSTDPEIVRRFAAAVLAEPELKEPDPAIRALEQGRRRALEIVRNEQGQARLNPPGGS